MIDMGNNNKTSTISKNTTERFQIVLLGDLNVGKSSLAYTIQTGKFNADFKQPIGTASFKKRLVIRDITIDLLIWEPISHKIFPNVWPKYVCMSDGVLLVYEVLDLKSFHSLTRLLSLIKKYNSVAVTFLVGTKSDCVDSAELSNETVEDFARKENLEQFQCSAKNGENVEKIFEHLVLRILQTKNLASEKKDEESSIILDDDNDHLEGKSQTENLKSRNPKDNSQLILTQRESFIMVEIKSHASEEKEGPFQVESNCRDPQKEVRASLIHEEVSEGKCTAWYIDQK